MPANDPDHQLVISEILCIRYRTERGLIDRRDGVAWQHDTELAGLGNR